MGKSDNIIFGIYMAKINEWLGTFEFQNIAFLGQAGENPLSEVISSTGKRDFFDLSLNNWNINDKDWEIENNSYDLIVCTRCAYFAKNPLDFITKCHGLLKPGGSMLVDWGLGDHWRFENYKVGWVKDGEHEYAYEEDNFLWSTAWHSVFNDTPEVKNFERLIKEKGYDNILKAISEEVPAILDLTQLHPLFEAMSADTLSLWEDMPQLYILLALHRAKEL